MAQANPNTNPQLIIEYDPVRNAIVYNTNVANCTPLMLGMVEWLRAELLAQLNESRMKLPPVAAGVQG